MSTRKQLPSSKKRDQTVKVKAGAISSSKTKLQIRPARLSEIPLLVEFQLKMAKETEGLALNKNTLKKGIQAVFVRPELGQILVATINDEVVASMFVQYEWSEWRNGQVLWVHSVYIEKMHRGKKIFSQMYRHLQQKVKNSDLYRGIRLYVDKTNIHAQNVYQKLRMSSQHYDLYEWLDV